jgi:membrane associated rhomboid family serine protease
MPECYRHPGVETGVSCSSCGRPICPDCMTPTPVGMRCPECSGEKTRIVSGPAAISGAGDWPATKVLIGICVAVYLLEILTGTGGLGAGGSAVLANFGVLGAGVAEGEWYRLITGGFLHLSIFHLAFNMVALFFLGRILEPSIGTVRFLAIYFASLLAGSFGAILLSGSFVNTVGASGAVFGIFGATFLIARGRGLDHIASQIGLILGINLLLTFTISGISIGGHIGGLVGGLACGALVVAGEKGRLGRSAGPIEYSAMAAIAIGSFIGAIAISEPVPGGFSDALAGFPYGITIAATMALAGLRGLNKGRRPYPVGHRKARWHFSNSRK